MTNEKVLFGSDLLLPLHLQFFAGDGESGESGESGEVEGEVDGQSTEETDGGQQENSFTQEQVNKIVADQIAREKAKMAKEFERKQTEAEKLGKMTKEQRVNAELEMARKRAEEAERKLNQIGLAKEARSILASKGVELDSDAILDVLVGEDAETTSQRVADFADVFKKSVVAEVNKRLGGTGQRNKNTTGKADGHKPLSEMSYEERTKLYTENPELYRELRNKQ